ncbi:MAG: DUF1203 domain-containing protein [Chitinophagaceae bacterium]
MNNFRIIPLSQEYARSIREKMTDDFNHPVIEQAANGKGPCRVSLQPFVPGKDRRLLFSHSPFSIDNAFNQPGPVFIDQREVEEYKDVYNFPPAIKADKKSFPITLIGYDREQMMQYTKLVGDDDIDDLISKIFDTQQEIEFLHARNAEAGCYICKIERRKAPMQ